MAKGGINVSFYDFFLPVKQTEDGSATPPQKRLINYSADLSPSTQIATIIASTPQ